MKIEEQTKNGEELPWNRLRKCLGSVTEVPQLGFFPLKQFFSLILSDSSIPERLNPFLLPFFPYLQEKRGRWLPPNSPRRPGLLPPEGTTFCWNPLLGPSGPGCYLHPLFTKYTPLLCFFADSFLKRYRTLRITQGHPFSFWNVAKLYGLCNNALFDFRNVGELYGLHNHPLFDLRNVTKPHLIMQRCFHLIFSLY